MIDEILITRDENANYDTLHLFQIKISNEVVYETSLPMGQFDVKVKTQFKEIEVVCDLPFLIQKQKDGFTISITESL
jgi:hypothetical protein